MENIRSVIKKCLSKNELPGIKSHQKLVPAFRPKGIPNAATVNAGVLILIYPDLSGVYYIVFMKRQQYIGAHSAQISFPGGKYEEKDLNLATTAIRECHEEIGINAQSVELLGELSLLYIPISNYLVHPFIGFTAKTPHFHIDKNEVDYLIEFPLFQALQLPIKQTELLYGKSQSPVPYFDINNEIVWGATAMILSEFIDVLKEIEG